MIKNRSSRGFTLFEIMVTLAIVGIMMTLVVGGMSRSIDRNMKKVSSQLASTIRYLYNKSALERLYIRLVFDIDARSYWVEATADPFAISREETAPPARGKKDRGKEEKKEETTAEKEGAAEEEGAKEGEIPKLKPPEPKFGQVDSHLLKPTKLPGRVFFKDIQVEHKSSPVEGGQASIYFFPNGYVEHAVINLRNEEDTINYSLETKPLSGSVTIEDQYRSIYTGK